MTKPSITELRGICQALSIPFTFADDAPSLQQKIDLKAVAAIERPLPPPAYVPEDARLRLRTPARECNPEMLGEMLKEHRERGLRLTFPTIDQWHMSFAAKEDSGTLRCPPRVVLGAANRLMS